MLAGRATAGQPPAWCRAATAVLYASQPRATSSSHWQQLSRWTRLQRRTVATTSAGRQWGRSGRNRDLGPPPPVWFGSQPYCRIGEAFGHRGLEDNILVSIETPIPSSVYTGRRFKWFSNHDQVSETIYRARDRLAPLTLYELVLDNQPRNLFFDLDGDLSVHGQFHNIYVTLLTRFVHWFFDIEDRDSSVKPCIIESPFSMKYSAHIVFPYIQFDSFVDQMTIIPLLLNCLYSLREKNVEIRSSWNLSNAKRLPPECGPPGNVSVETGAYPLPGGQCMELGPLQYVFDPPPPPFLSKQFATQQSKEQIQVQRAPHYRLWEVVDRALYTSSQSLRAPYTRKIKHGEYTAGSLLVPSQRTYYDNDSRSAYIGYCNPAWRSPRFSLATIRRKPQVQEVIQTFGLFGVDRSYRAYMELAGMASLAASRGPKSSTCRSIDPSIAIEGVSQLQSANDVIWKRLSAAGLTPDMIGLLDPRYRMSRPLSELDRQFQRFVKHGILQEGDLRDILDLSDANGLQLFKYCLRLIHPERANDWSSWFHITAVTAGFLLTTDDPASQELALISFLEWSSVFPRFSVNENLALLFTHFENALLRSRFTDLQVLFPLVEFDNPNAQFKWPAALPPSDPRMPAPSQGLPSREAASDVNDPTSLAAALHEENVWMDLIKSFLEEVDPPNNVADSPSSEAEAPE